MEAVEEVRLQLQDDGLGGHDERQPLLQEIADLLKREELNFGMAFEEADGDLRIARPGQPPAIPSVVTNGENA